MQSKLFSPSPKSPPADHVFIHNTSQEGVIVPGGHFIALNEIVLWQDNKSLVFLALFKNNISTVVLSLEDNGSVNQHLEAFEKHSGAVCTRNFLTVYHWNEAVRNYMKPCEMILEAAGMRVSYGSIYSEVWALSNKSYED